MSEEFQRKNQNSILFSKNFYSSAEKSKTQAKTTEPDGSSRSTLILFLLFGTFIILIAFFGEYGILAFQELKQKEQNLTTAIQTLKNQEQSLLQEIDALKNNPEYIESLARKELGLVRKNEVIYFLLEMPPSSEKQ